MASVSSAAGVIQSGMQQLKVQQAQRNAEQAERTAELLRAKANEAQRFADQAQEEARALDGQANRARAVAGQARQGVAALNTARQAVTQLSQTVDQVLTREILSAAATQNAGSAPVVEGRVAGTIIDTTA